MLRSKNTASELSKHWKASRLQMLGVSASGQHVRNIKAADPAQTERISLRLLHSLATSLLKYCTKWRKEVEGCWVCRLLHLRLATAKSASHLQQMASTR